MLAGQRKAHLLGLLLDEGRIVAKTAAAELGVSEDSIRRDLRELADEGALVRVYGGALPVPPADRPVAERSELATASKGRVARLAVQRIRPSSTIVLDGGTTALALARLLPRGTGLTVITPSPAVALATAESTDARLIMIGGELTRHSLVAGGALALEAVQHLGADAFFLGVTGVHPEHGLTTGDLDDAVTKRALAARSADVYVLASEEKIGAVSRFPVLPLASVTAVIADPSDRNPLLAELPLG
ncbi:DeoR/GlpR family DNA-binding transcription regulator [Herbiconiux flava]|uniref:Lactose phosphotransferase system repressor n=1 Tax=Herbiconiux flava TaxID=881268 RepID=A0A852SLT0_9MICO|nr:DeoR/GlpR family DNA-binding transcription regulator [Herbiconiux flava]NYD69369.1 DeoR/GlpR family transcriptional regulator of sugar metabolism [Herbiconiux flava]GLK16115.1 DeoR family transcriptional regulator [Herbiconiux flava]